MRALSLTTAFATLAVLFTGGAALAAPTFQRHGPPPFHHPDPGWHGGDRWHHDWPGGWYGYGYVGPTYLADPYPYDYSYYGQPVVRVYSSGSPDWRYNRIVAELHAADARLSADRNHGLVSASTYYRLAGASARIRSVAIRDHRLGGLNPGQYYQLQADVDSLDASIAAA